ncbi:MAG: methionyl-tRNA formyltransferase [Lachnospiraceae bacterium]|nr:methionyl-tRNA formyltransferase [Lachnospiraceae bacterium]
MKLVFFGTPDFAVSALAALHDAGHTIVSVVTQPDKPKGRSGKLQASPVKEFALAHDIPVLQPVRVREEAAVEELRATGAEVFVVAAFGQILPKTVLEIPPLGCINIHASLLPKLRGASPIQTAILTGEEKTGITIMQMDEGCDTGDILLQEELPIAPDDTGGSLFDKLAALGAEAVVKALPLLAEGKLPPKKQEEEKVTLSAKFTKESGKIDWQKDAAYLSRLVRAVNPWPCAYTTLGGKTLKIWEAFPLQSGEEVPVTADGKAGADRAPGSVLYAAAEGILVQTGDGILRITELQPESKKRMRAADFLNGTRLTAGELLGR